MKEDINTTAGQSKKKTANKTIFYTVGTIVLVGAIAGGSFYAGTQYGKKRAQDTISQKVTQALNPLSLLSNNPLLPNSFIGSISKIDNGTITIKLATGEQKKVEVNSTAQITQQSKTLTVNDLKTDQKVTVFVKKDGDKQVATRILVR